MNDKQMFYIEPGFAEPTRIYKIKLVEVARLKDTVEGINRRLDELGATLVVIDNSNPQLIDRIKTRRFVRKLMRRLPPNTEKG